MDYSPSKQKLRPYPARVLLEASFRWESDGQIVEALAKCPCALLHG